VQRRLWDAGALAPFRERVALALDLVEDEVALGVRQLSDGIHRGTRTAGSVGTPRVAGVEGIKGSIREVFILDPRINLFGDPRGLVTHEARDNLERQAAVSGEATCQPWLRES